LGTRGEQTIATHDFVGKSKNKACRGAFRHRLHDQPAFVTLPILSLPPLSTMPPAITASLTKLLKPPATLSPSLPVPSALHASVLLSPSSASQALAMDDDYVGIPPSRESLTALEASRNAPSWCIHAWAHASTSGTRPPVHRCKYVMVEHLLKKIAPDLHEEYCTASSSDAWMTVEVLGMDDAEGADMENGEWVDDVEGPTDNLKGSDGESENGYDIDENL
jgi:hypothetical protein